MNRSLRSSLQTLAACLLISGCASQADEYAGSGGKADDPAATAECFADLAALEEGAPRNVLFYDVAVDQFSGGQFSGNARMAESTAIDLPQPSAAAGQTLQIRYLGGLNQDDALSNVSVGMKINGEDKIVEMERDEEFAPQIFSKLRVDMPFDLESLELWFQAEDADGAIVFDSRDGANYPVHVLPAPQGALCFSGGFESFASGELVAGQSIEVAYDYNRIFSQMKRDLGFFQRYEIEVGTRFRDGAGTAISEGTQPIVRAILFAGEDIFDVTNLLVPVEVPANAARMEMWFHGSAAGRNFFDSNFGSNYVFDIAQP